MFGFGNNPDSETSNELGRQAYQASQFMTYIQLKNSLPPNKGEEPLSLEDENSRTEIIKCFDTIIENNNLDVVLQPSATEKINSLAIKASKGGESQLYENTLALMTVMNSINGVAKMFYVNFPKSKKLFSLVNEMTKTCMPAISIIFGGHLKSSYRIIWPHLSSVFEAHRANG